MNRAVPGWLFLLSLLIGALFTMVFGWSVKSALVGNNRAGFLGDAAVAVANFPTMAKNVFVELTTENDILIRTPRPDMELSGFEPVRTRPGIRLDGLLVKADKAAVSHADGWRLLVGAFTVDGATQNAVLALSPTLEVVNVWKLAESAIAGRQPRSPNRRFVHGLDVMKDGSIIFSFEGGISLQRVDQCGSRVWAVGGQFHHSVTIDDTGSFLWTMRQAGEMAELVQMKTANGQIVRSISMKAIIAANPDLDILEVRTLDENNMGSNRPFTPPRKWLPDLHEAFHLNDVDPLPKSLADRFEGFEPGDLLVSARSLNMVFVVDPDTLKVKWWRVGAFRRQHDPDWGWHGEITVYDNRMGRDYSRIVSIAPTSYRTKVMFDGRSNRFYSRVRGKHQFTESGNLIVVSSQQGRVFEVDRNGKSILEFINQKPGSTEHNLVVSQAIWLPRENFNFMPVKSCTR